MAHDDESNRRRMGGCAATAETPVYATADRRPNRVRAAFYFSTTKLPMISASMPELKNVRMASVGELTMGSPRRLNEVFMTTGTPVRLAKFADQPPVERIHVALDGLRAGAAIHVRDRRNHAAFFGPHLRGENHEGRIGGGFQIVASGFRRAGKERRGATTRGISRRCSLSRSFQDRADRRGWSGCPARAGQIPCGLEPSRGFFHRRAIRRLRRRDRLRAWREFCRWRGPSRFRRRSTRCPDRRGAFCGRGVFRPHRESARARRRGRRHRRWRRAARRCDRRSRRKGFFRWLWN